jgi:DNA polymerase elongation subunit (family B)
MVVWLLCEDGRRIRAVDPFVPTCYLAAPPPIREQACRLLRRTSCRIGTSEVERYELGALRPTPVLEVSVHAPAQFSSLTQQLICSFPDAQFFHVDVSLPQRYFYDRELFPLAHCEVDLTAEGRIQSIQALESLWDTDYGFPPLAIMELSPDSSSPNPNHGGRGSLVVRMDGEERVLEGEDANVIQRLNQLLLRHDPDILLTDWGDSYLLPRS